MLKVASKPQRAVVFLTPGLIDIYALLMAACIVNNYDYASLDHHLTPPSTALEAKEGIPF